jgi:hypothetical protein
MLIALPSHNASCWRLDVDARMHALGRALSPAAVGFRMRCADSELMPVQAELSEQLE